MKTAARAVVGWVVAALAPSLRRRRRWRTGVCGGGEGCAQCGGGGGGGDGGGREDGAVAVAGTAFVAGGGFERGQRGERHGERTWTIEMHALPAKLMFDGSPTKAQS